MANKNISKAGVKFGSGQPTNLGGRPKKEPLFRVIQDKLSNDGFIRFKASDVVLMEDGTYRVAMPTQDLIATKFLQMVMKGDARYMDMYMKLFGEYQAEKHEVSVNSPLKGIDFDNLNDDEMAFLEKIAKHGE